MTEDEKSPVSSEQAEEKKDKNNIFDAFDSLLVVSGGNSGEGATGFNKFDSAFAQKLEEHLDKKIPWTNRQKYAVWRMLRKYKNQLAGFGIDYYKIEKPKLAIEEDTRRIVSYVEDFKCFEIRCEYNPDVIAELKSSFTGREWKSDIHSWYVVANRSNVFSLQDYASKHGFVLDEAADKAVKAILDGETHVGDVVYDKNLNGFVLRFPYEEALVVKVKALNECKWDAAIKSWVFPADYRLMDKLEKFAKDEHFLLAGGTLEAMKQTREHAMESIEDSKALSAELDIPGLNGTLYPFQRAAVRYAMKKDCNVLIADEQGLGKTMSAIGTIQKMNLYPAIIICPNSVKYNWEREIRKWIPQHTVEVIDATSKITWFNTDVTIINYDIVRKHHDDIIKQNYRVLILDESQYVKDKKTIRGKECHLLAETIPKRLLLSGTPIVNRPSELVSPLMILGRIREFGSISRFLQRYAAAHEGRFGWDTKGASNLEELHQKLRAICMIRRRKEDVLTELPDKQYSLVPLKLDNEEEYRKAENDVVAFITERAVKNKSFLASIAHLSFEQQNEEIASRARSVEAQAERNEELRRIEVCKQLAVKGKFKDTVEWIKTVLDSGEKLIMFATHRAVVTGLCDTFVEDYGAVKIMGDMGAKERDDVVQKFQTDPNTRLIVCNIQAGGIGITLTASSTVGFVELEWTPSAHRQAEDRSHRIGQKDSVNVYYLLAAGTIDEEIYALLEDKRRVVDAATDGITTPSAETSIYKQLVGILAGKAKGTPKVINNSEELGSV